MNAPHPDFAEHERVLSRAVIIIGAGGRTGTSLLARLLSLHPAFTYVPEPRVVWRWGNERHSDMFNRRHARPEVKRHIRSFFVGQLEDHQGTRLLEKTPSNALRMEFIDEVLPDCQFVHILRDGRDAVLGIHRFWRDHSRGVHWVNLRKRLSEVRPSQLPQYLREFLRRVLPGRLAGRAYWGSQLPGFEGMLRELDPLDIACLQWRFSVEAACHVGRSLPEGRYLEVRLEELSHPVIQRILDFCDVEVHPAVFERFDDRYDPDRSAARRPAVPPETLARIDRWIRPTQEWLGYD